MPAICRFLFFLLIAPLHLFAQQLVVYPSPPKDFDHGSAIYNITIKQGSTVKQTYVYVSHAGNDLSQKEWGGQQGKSFHYAIFSFSGSVTIQVSKSNSKAKTAIVRPSSAGINTTDASVSNNTSSVNFTLSRPGKISVEFEDDPLNREALMIFADSLEKASDIPSASSREIYTPNSTDKNIVIPTDKSILYFAPGVYEPGYFELPPSVKQVYIAGGAFVRGYMFANRSKDQSLLINGRGVLSNDRWPYHFPVNTLDESEYRKWYRMITINGGNRHRIEGITFVDPSAMMIAIYSSNHNIVENININAFRYNNDALNLHGDNNLITNCFLRSNEDVIAMNDNNTTVENCTFWQLHNGSIIQLGWVSHNISGNNVIENCTILHGEWDNEQNSNSAFINIMNVTPPKTPVIIENLLVKNIYAETEVLRFADLRITRNGKGQPLVIKNFTFDNIHLKRNNLKSPLFYLAGFDSAHTVSNLVLHNIYLNNVRIDDDLLQKTSTEIFKVDAFADSPVFKND